MQGNKSCSEKVNWGASGPRVVSASSSTNFLLNIVSSTLFTVELYHKSHSYLFSKSGFTNKELIFKTISYKGIGRRLSPNFFRSVTVRFVTAAKDTNESRSQHSNCCGCPCGLDMVYLLEVATLHVWVWHRGEKMVEASGSGALWTVTRSWINE